MTGARILCTLMNDLRTLDKTIGMESMCVAGGQGMAIIVERLTWPVLRAVAARVRLPGQGRRPAGPAPERG
jgi:Thiolase, C-terminal domain